MDVCCNGAFFDAGTPLLTVQNRSFKWGDGVFETARCWKGKLLLQQYHFERLFGSLQLLGITTPPNFNAVELTATILELCKRNNCLENARVRLAVFRDEESVASYTIEAIPLQPTVNDRTREGQIIDVYPLARKSMDVFANLKTANFLPYVMASRYATENQLDDAIVLNADGFLCDSSRANIFLLKDKMLYTPALHQGCVNGVVRRVIIEKAEDLGYGVQECSVDVQLLQEADEVFLTNAVQLLRWVKTYRDRTYQSVHAEQIFKAIQATIFTSYC